MGSRGLEALLLLAAGVSCAALAVLLLRHWPRGAVLLWAPTVAFVPYWLGPTVKVFLPPTTLVAVVIVLALLPVADFRWHPVDALLSLLLVGFALASLVGMSTLSVGFTLMAEWLPAYVVGRLLASAMSLRRIYGTVAAVLTVAAILALLEFATGWNPFVRLSMGNSQFAAWGELQARGGVFRAEGGFGHSIALGASLAIGVPLAMASRAREAVKLGMVAALLAATVVTFSRIGMVCAVLALLLSVIFLREGLSRRGRALFVTMLTVAAAAALPLVDSVFEAAGSEAANSAAYRSDLLSTVGDMNPIGLASSFVRTPTGEVVFSNFRSIDSQMILLGLTFGWLSLLLVAGLLAAAVIVVLRGQGSAPTIAIVAQIPAFMAVALITQYAALVWFLAGLAVTSQVAARRRAVETSTDRRDSPAVQDPQSTVVQLPACVGGYGIGTATERTPWTPSTT